VKAVLAGNVHAAAAANPFGIVMVATAIVLLARPAWRRLHVPGVVLVGGVAASWLFELHRFHFI
jgi:MFS superfamily sulfate permease-like transporter